MRLIGFRVQNYKTVVDSGEVKVRPDVTCLLGQNESGKSAIMQAIWKSHNVAGRKFDMLYDYPKHAYSRDRGTDPIVTTLQFAFEPADEEAFRERFPDIETPKSVTWSTTYKGQHVVKVDLDAKSADVSPLNALADELVHLPPSPDAENDVLEPVRTQARAAVEAVASGDYPAIRESVTALIAALKQHAPQLGERAASDLLTLDRLHGMRSRDEILDDVGKFASDRLPAFIYFDEYGLLRTRIHLPDYLAGVKTSPPDAANAAKLRTQTALFEWARVTPEEVLRLGRSRQDGETQEQVERRKEERDTLLESASFSLTGDWKEWWQQAREHRLHMKADGDDLVLKVSDDKNPWAIDFQERSRGFQWFFSFYLTFLVESSKAHRGAILLLDEPGLHLHITAQRRLLGFFQTVAKKNQLIYSTHSPHMVDGDHIENVRTVYLKRDDTSGFSHTKVSHSTEPEGDHDTVLPLQAALGYGVADTLFLGKKVLIVEGITDFWILKGLSAELARQGRPALPEDIVVLFAGGASRVLPLVSLFMQPDHPERRMVVLLDADKTGLDKAKSLKRELLRLDRTVALMSDADLLGLPAAEIEDVVSLTELEAAIEKRRGTFSRPTVVATTTVAFLKEVYKQNGWGDLTHEEKALTVMALVDMWREGRRPDSTTLVNAEKVIHGLIGRFA